MPGKKKGKPVRPIVVDLFDSLGLPGGVSTGGSEANNGALEVGSPLLLLTATPPTTDPRSEWQWLVGLLDLLLH